MSTESPDLTLTDSSENLCVGFKRAAHKKCNHNLTALEYFWNEVSLSRDASMLTDSESKRLSGVIN